MSERRTHWQHPTRALLSWCKIPAVRITTNEAEVTCRPCRALLDDAADWRRHHYGVAVPVPESDLDSSTRRIVNTLKRQGVSARPWPSWRAAVRAYQRWVDDGVPLKSSAAPSRFETVGVSTGETPEGDLAQRRAGPMSHVRKVLRGAFDRGYEVSTFPTRLVIGPEECLRILIVVTCGADRNTRTGTSGGKRKQHIVERFPVQRRVYERGAVDGDMTMGDVAARASERVGFEVTVGDVQHIWRHGARRIEDALWRDELVSCRDKSLEDEMAEKITPDWDLDGWEAIADALNLDVKTAQRYERDHGLPVQRYGGMVRAESGKLREWLTDFLARKAG